MVDVGVPDRRALAIGNLNGLPDKPSCAIFFFFSPFSRGYSEDRGVQREIRFILYRLFCVAFLFLSL